MNERQFRRIVKTYVEASIDLSWRGSMEPAMMDEVDRRYKAAKAAYQAAVRELFPNRESLSEYDITQAGDID